MSLNGWTKLWRFSKMWPLSPEASWLFAQLLLKANEERLDLGKWFEFADDVCKSATRLSTHRLRKARRQLAEQQFIRYKPGSAHQLTTYQLLTDGRKEHSPLKD